MSWRAPGTGLSPPLPPPPSPPVHIPLLTRCVRPAACTTNIPFSKRREGRRELGKGSRRRLWILPVAGGRSPGRERRCPGGRLRLHQSPEGPARAPAKHCTRRTGKETGAGPPPRPCPGPAGPPLLPCPAPAGAGSGATSGVRLLRAERFPHSDWWMSLSLRAKRAKFGFWVVAPPPPRR